MEGIVDRNVATEREKIEERHRNEILNLLKSFEFEKKDIEARFRQELESKENERERLDEKVQTEERELQNLSQSDVLELQERWKKEQDEQKVEFEKEKEELLLRISELEGRMEKEDKTDDGCPSTVRESGKIILRFFTTKILVVKTTLRDYTKIMILWVSIRRLQVKMDRSILHE